MNHAQLKRPLPLLATVTTTAFALVSLVSFMSPVAAKAAVGPVKEIFSSHLGGEVNETGGNICFASEKCRPATFGSKPGIFENVNGVAGAPDGNFYVVDT